MELISFRSATVKNLVLNLKRHPQTLTSSIVFCFVYLTAFLPTPRPQPQSLFPYQYGTNGSSTIYPIPSTFLFYFQLTSECQISPTSNAPLSLGSVFPPLLALVLGCYFFFQFYSRLYSLFRVFRYKLCSPRSTSCDATGLRAFPQYQPQRTS